MEVTQIWKRKLLSYLRDILKLITIAQHVFMQIGMIKKTVSPTVMVATADITVLATETAASTGEVNL